MNIHDRSRKVYKRAHRMPVNGIAMKRLLVEQAARLRREFADSARRTDASHESSSVDASRERRL